MKSLIYFFFVVLCLVRQPAAAETETVIYANHVPNQLMVKFFPDVTEAEKVRVRDASGAIRYKHIKSIGVEHWILPESVGVAEAIRQLETEPSVEYAEPNFLLKPNALPDDPDLGKLWYLDNVGQVVNGLAGEAGADISAIEAWDIETGSAHIVIAVIDTGVAFEHPELIDNVWTNLDEIDGDGFDNDNNGYIDDTHGWDFVNDDNDPSDYSSDLYGNGHGTHVAGTIAATGNNAVGIAGVMWHCRIMPLQVFDLFGTRSFREAVIQLSNIASAIEYAVENGARIINGSFGTSSFSQTLYDSIQFAHAHGVLFIAAAGNDSINSDIAPGYPASYDLDNIISVAATDERDALASYSNFGPTTIDVAAPGGSGAAPNILSTIPPVREVIFQEDFESGLSRWTAASVYEDWSIGYDAEFDSLVVMDSAADYQAGEDSAILTAGPIDVDGIKGLSLEFKIRFELEDNYDYWFADFSDDGTTFSTEYFATGSSSGIIEFQDWKGNAEFEDLFLRFRLVTDASNNFDGVFMDDIVLTGIPWVFSGNEYGYKSGTSMAAPVVAGIAGLVWSRHDTFSHLEVKNAVLRSVDRLDHLDGNVLSGGRVNAYRALVLDFNPNDAEAMFTGGSEGGGCFIATAAYDSPENPDVLILRNFRDRFLVGNLWGRKLVDAYYHYSPAAASYISKHESLKTIIRLGLIPIICFSMLSLKWGMGVTLFGCAVITAAALFLVSFYRRTV